MSIVELAKKKRAEIDTLKEENSKMKAKLETADALVTEIEKDKGKLSDAAVTALSEYKAKK